MKPVHVAGLAVALAILCVPLASARPAFRQATADLFNLKKDGQPDLTCQFCHVNAGGGASWNKFGDAVRTKIRGDAAGNVSQALYLVVKDAKDSDGDGYADGLEVFAKTLPGDDKSKPEKAVADLQKDYDAKGGADQYKPKP
jgi:hypothetical protein